MPDTKKLRASRGGLVDVAKAMTYDRLPTTSIPVKDETNSSDTSSSLLSDALSLGIGSPFETGCSPATPASPDATISDVDADSETPAISYERDEGSDGVLRLKPTMEQWDNFTAILSVARNLGAEQDGCFKVIIPEEALGPRPERPERTVDANAFKPQLIKATRNYRVHTVPTTTQFPASTVVEAPEEPAEPREAINKLRKLFSKNNNRQLRNVRYRVDVPAWTPAQRLAAGVPEQSPIHPLLGDRLERTKAIIPGIHTPYVYEAGPAFGATFQIHAEDYRLLSLNHLYEGRKIWIIIPSTSVDVAEEQLERKNRCSQFMRHRAEFVFPEKLDRLKVPYRIIDQRPGETIVILQDAYHEGFSDGYTLAEAKNYADASWQATTYQPCDTSCQLATAIPGDHMRLVQAGEERLDLCTAYCEEVKSRKRSHLETDTEDTPLDKVDSDHQTTVSTENPRPVQLARLD